MKTLSFVFLFLLSQAPVARGAVVMSPSPAPVGTSVIPGLRIERDVPGSGMLPEPPAGHGFSAPAGGRSVAILTIAWSAGELSPRVAERMTSRGQTVWNNDQEPPPREPLFVYPAGVPDLPGMAFAEGGRETSLRSGGFPSGRGSDADGEAGDGALSWLAVMLLTAGAASLRVFLV